MGPKKHIHKYKRTKLGKSIIYRCMLVACPHFISKDLIEGRLSICSRCETPFVITKRTLKNCPANPHCENCYPKSTEDIILDAAIDEILK